MDEGRFNVGEAPQTLSSLRDVGLVDPGGPAPPQEDASGSAKESMPGVTLGLGVRPDAAWTAIVAGAAAANSRQRPNQDRWAAGCNDAGAWAVVADGISADSYGANAAQVAVNVASRFLCGSRLLEGDLLSAVDAAAAAVGPWYSDSGVGTSGGTTLTVAAITPHRRTIVAVGDSPAYLLDGGRLLRQTPAPVRGPLRDWVGMLPRTVPWLVSHPHDPSRDGPVIIATDGLYLDDYAPMGSLSPEALSTELLDLRPESDADDAALAVISFRPAGGLSKEPGWTPTLRMDQSMDTQAGVVGHAH